MEIHPFALCVVADRVVHSIREITADCLIVKVRVLGRFHPLTRLRVADSVLGVLWLFTTLPEVGIIEPFELNPLAIPTDGVFHVCRDVSITGISWESCSWALSKAFLWLLWLSNPKMYGLCGASDES